MAAGEDQTQAIVGHGVLLAAERRLVGHVQQHGLRVSIFARSFAAKMVDRAAARGGDDPSRRAGWQAAVRPATDRFGECVLDRLLGESDVAEDTDQDSHRTAILGAEHTVDL